MALDTENLDALRIDRSERDAGGGGRTGVAVAVLLAVAVAVSAAVIFYLRSGAPTVTVVLARAPASADSGAVLNASGYVTARRLATVSSKVTGKIRDVLVEEGLSVDAGQPLAYLDDSSAVARHNLALSQLHSARNGLAETQVRLDEARRTLARTQTLRESGLASAAALDAAQAEVNALSARLATARGNVDVAQRQVDVSQQELDDLVIRAPFAGVVISKNAQPGEMISPISAGGGFTRTGICTIVDMQSLEIEVDVNEAYINRVSPGQAVLARLDAYPNQDLPASVLRIVPAADRQKATVRVRIAFGTLDDRILPDMGVKVRFMENERPDSDGGTPAAALVVASAVGTDGDRSIVWVVNSNTVERRAVAVGQRRGADLEVMAGLRPGERVVDNPASTLSDGLQVEIATTN